MEDEIYTRVELRGAIALFLLDEADEYDSVGNIDVRVQVDDGSEWTATMLTLEEIARLMRRWKDTGEYLAGRYFRGNDLVIVDAGGIPRIRDLLQDLIDTGEFPFVLQPVQSAWETSL